MPPSEYKSISITKTAYTKALTAKQERNCTWSELILEACEDQEAFDPEELVESVRQDKVDSVVVEFDEAALERLANRVGERVKRELKGGPY